MTNSYQLPPSAAADYQRDGAVVLRGVLSPAQVEQLQQGIEHNLAHLSPTTTSAAGKT